MSTVRLPPLSAFQAHFDAATWQRGQGYAQQGLADMIELMPDEPSPGSYVLMADVQGSDVEPYAVTIEFSESSKGRLTLASECTCPVGSACKHTVATIIQALEQGWSAPEDGVMVAMDSSGADATTVAEIDSDDSTPGDTPSARRWPWATGPSEPFQANGRPNFQSNPISASRVAREHEALERWLRAKDMVAQRQTPARASTAEAHRLVYVLSSQAHEPRGSISSPPDSGQAHWLCLWPAKAKPLKNKPGQWGKPALLKTQYGRLFSESDGQGEVFQVMRRWLLGQATASHSWGHIQEGLSLGPSSAVQDPIGLQVLQAALATGDVVTLDDAGFIEATWQWGEPREVNWAWEKQEGPPGKPPRWRARPDLGDVRCELRLGAPALYLDHTTHTVGPVPTLQSAAQLADWLMLPPLPEDWMRERAHRLLPLAPPLPTAVIGEVSRVIQGILPVPHLRVARAPEGLPNLLVLHLSFDYDGVRGIWAAHDSPQQWMDTPRGRVLLHRQPEAEAPWFTPFTVRGYQSGPDDEPPAIWTARHAHGNGASPDLSPQARDRALLANDLREFRDMGFVVTHDVDLQARMRSATKLDLDMAAMTAEGQALGELDDTANARWFSLSLGFEVDGQRVNLLPWLPQLLDHVGRQPVPSGPDAAERDRIWLHSADTDQWWQVPVTPLRPWLATMLELVGDRQHDTADAQALRLSRFEAMRLAAADDPGRTLALSGMQAQSLHALVQSLKAGGMNQPVAIPEGLNAELRPYQHQGLSWLQFLARHQLGGVLADDMGLGKTLQTIAHLWVEKQNGRLNHPALVVAPTSLVGNWRNELHRFAPGLRALVLHGAQRNEQFERIAHSDVVITTYPLLSRDQEVLTAQSWSVVVLDEAQTIKNAKTQAAVIVQGLNARQRLCLSGTPMENHLGEVWSLFHFLMPGYLGSDSRFRQLFRTPIEKHGDTERLALLRARLAPFMLRRSKALVASELPPKVENIEHVSLSPGQAKLYETIRLTTERQVREALNSKGLARSHITVLDALLKLRQVCCDPRLVPLASAAQVQESAKLDWLIQNLPEMIAEGRRVLLFSQFTSMLDLIEAELPALGLRWTKLTGQSVGREALIERFTSGEVPLFLISLKAGGVGLNLPQADTVIHYDPWWNPAVEDQATDRAHRLGQTQTVFVHKLVAEGTLEERILTLQARKAALARGLHGQATAEAAALTESDLNWLLQPLSAGLPDTPA